jgi:hypothetical protein
MSVYDTEYEIYDELSSFPVEDEDSNQGQEEKQEDDGLSC